MTDGLGVVPVQAFLQIFCGSRTRGITGRTEVESWGTKVDTGGAAESVVS